MSKIPLEGYCYHFGCPIDSHSPRNRNLLDQHIKDTKIIVRLCRQYNLKLVYASTVGVQCPDHDTQYKTTKIIAESMLDPDRDLIWRIPRVYSLDRSRGLIPQLKQGLMPNPGNILQWAKLIIEIRISKFTPEQN